MVLSNNRRKTGRKLAVLLLGLALVVAIGGIFFYIKVANKVLVKSTKRAISDNYQILGFKKDTYNLVRLGFKNGRLEEKVVAENIFNDEAPGGYIYGLSHVGVSTDKSSYYLFNSNYTKVSFYNNEGVLIGDYTNGNRLNPEKMWLDRGNLLYVDTVYNEMKDPRCEGVCPHDYQYQISVGNLGGEQDKIFEWKGETWVDSIDGIVYFDPTKEELIYTTHGEPVTFVRILDLATGKLMKFDEALYCAGSNGKVLAMVSPDNDKLTVVDLGSRKAVFVFNDEGKDVGCPVLDAKRDLELQIEGVVYKIAGEKLEQIIDVQSLRKNFPGYGFDLLDAAYEKQYLFRLGYNGPYEYVYIKNNGERGNISLINWGLSMVIGFLQPEM